LAVTRRGKVAIAFAGVVGLTGVSAGALAITGHAPAPLQHAYNSVTGHAEAPPPACPLTDRDAPGGKIPQRPVLAVKVENLPEARPQAGLDRADIVYEEPVEGGITRFIALFQCQEAADIGPIRSGRTTDPEILVQFGKPALAYSGGAQPVVKAIDRAGLVDVSEPNVPQAYEHDPARVAPHDVFSSTARLRKAGKVEGHAPAPVFSYTESLEGLRSRRTNTVHLPFSSYSDVFWTWSKKQGVWLRAHGSEPHMLVDGSQVQATNVVVQTVHVVPGDIIDPAGNPSPEVQTLGSGKAYIFRNGRMVVGRWERATLDDTTTFATRSGDPIPLAPGNTWVELLPSTVVVDTT
jgi:hypothetical protein